MNIYVLDESKNVCGIVDNYKSVIWTTRYFSSGDFELYLSATNENIALLQPDYYLVREEDMSASEYKNVMIIKNIELTTNAEQGNFLIVTGKSLKSIIGRRIIWGQTILSGKVESGIRLIINENAISPTMAERKINGLILDEIKGYTDTMNVQVTGANIAEWLQKICTTYGMGWDVFIRGENFVFTIWKGIDRSYGQTTVPWVVFGPEYDNLLSSDYKFASDNYCNVALVAGEGEGLARKTFAVGSAEDLKRYEMYVDSRDVSTNDGEVTEDEYNNMLEEQGIEALAEKSVAQSFEGTVAPNRNFILNEDYFLGDVVQVINEYGISSSPRIIEIIDSEDENGRTVIPTFSTMEV